VGPLWLHHHHNVSECWVVSLAADVHGAELDGAPVRPGSGVRYESMFSPTTVNTTLRNVFLGSLTSAAVCYPIGGISVRRLLPPSHGAYTLFDRDGTQIGHVSSVNLREAMSERDCHIGE
jgi:hypothetical protein